METGLIIGGVGLSVLIIPIIAALKSIGLPKNWCPITAIVLGLIVAIAYALSTSDITLWGGIAGGIVAGAGAAGLYDTFTTNPTVVK